MTDLIERYVHQVGRYLPQDERADIEAELRSQIQDQLDDRYDGSPSQADVAAVLAELGDPRRMAASYHPEQYLVGPALYPFMAMIVRHGWIIIPTIVIFLNIFGALISSQPISLFDLFIETLLAVLQTTLIFFAVVVLIFAIIQRISAELDKNEATFNPLDLPKVDDPFIVDRIEAAFGLVIGTFTALALLYFLRVGGLTLQFNLNNPGEVIPVPVIWLILLICAVIAMLVLHVMVLRRNRWNSTLWLTETLLEVFGMICLYFVLYEPLLERIVTAVPTIGQIAFIESVPETFVIITAVITLVGRGNRLVRLWNYGSGTTTLKVKNG